MKCMQPDVRLPVDFEGEHLNILIGAEGRVWVCIDGESVFRAKSLKLVTVEDNRLPAQKRGMLPDEERARLTNVTTEVDLDSLHDGRYIWK